MLRPVDVGADVAVRPASHPTRELILFVGGIGSRTSDTTFDDLMDTYFGDPRYEVRRLGSLPDYAYDSHGSLDAAATALVTEIRELGRDYAGVHLIAHSMGGAVVDRAFALGLSHDDGVLTYVALASPHNGSLASQLGQGLIALEGDGFTLFRETLGRVQDPGSVAAGDLAATRPVAPPRGVARLDLRMSSDAVVLRRDAYDPGIDSRVLSPVDRGFLAGHGGITADPHAIALVRATIEQHSVPPDERSALLRLAADSEDLKNGMLVGACLFAFTGVCALVALELRRRRLVRRAEAWVDRGVADGAREVARATGSVAAGICNGVADAATTIARATAAGAPRVWSAVTDGICRGVIHRGAAGPLW
ncbi:MAG: esterase/lipase family protein [Candidatus Limnocylindria bacterium]